MKKKNLFGWSSLVEIIIHLIFIRVLMVFVDLLFFRKEKTIFFFFCFLRFFFSRSKFFGSLTQFDVICFMKEWSFQDHSSFLTIEIFFFLFLLFSYDPTTIIIFSCVCTLIFFICILCLKFMDDWFIHTQVWIYKWPKDNFFFLFAKNEQFF